MTISGSFSSFGTTNSLNVKNNQNHFLSTSPNLNGNSILSSSFGGSSSFQNSNYLIASVNSTVITESFKLLDNPW
ncbi:hypothetical protein DDB_G0271888 [Dictyostelium discoideum AX4]|uniref:Uncharacterized protein DDB_G0271888 n=1 Tax=Dictyostelium discoideum TaxID=44689 RepID=Y8561_DICDI|nr:hypothetical protein DDB_G0271888 [Dictyostelium discoideum AX4]Q86I89.1 RecName: Full=Uncharacterized protein DDB_G0271888 [Dictyostelium discoideum]EAL71468.1 hypothetical protein DDB_G0271888 [Dictyostelium discoideum AX4]|eukprot:XP_645408.1 hypothetical protein DDB_G0271888 [Dictyostelium discoideum AX4]